MREIVVVCYGNICRSPMGEVLLQRALDERLGEGAILVTSAGIGADDGRPPSTGTIRAMAERGRALVEARYSLEAMLDTLESLYWGHIPPERVDAAR